MAWAELAAAFAAFFLTHSVPLRPPVRRRLVARLGRAGFAVAYSALSLAALAWLVVAAGRAPFVPLWSWAPWQMRVPQAAMVLVCLILALSIARPNPFSFGGARDDAFDPRRPGIVRWLRHPILAALALWAGAHLVPNGDLAHVVLFGAFAGFALLGMAIVDRRKRRLMGAGWAGLLRETRAGALLPMPRALGPFAVRLAAAAAGYAILVWLHPRLFGVSPFG